MHKFSDAALAAAVETYGREKLRVESAQLTWHSGSHREAMRLALEEACKVDGVRSVLSGNTGGPTVDDPHRSYCRADQSCCDFCCGN